MGEKVIDTVIRAQRDQLPPTRDFDSRHLGLSTSFGDYDTVAAAFEAAAARRPEAGLPRETRIHLARLYGTAHEQVLRLVTEHPELAERVDGSDDILAQAVYAVTEEAAETLTDVLDRRLTVGTLGLVSEQAVNQVAGTNAPLLGWDDATRDGQAQAYLAQLSGETAVIDDAFRSTPPTR